MSDNIAIKPKVALVLGSGGARGIAHIGVIRELINHGYEISSISGSSMGALVGGVYASGKLDEFEVWLRSLKKRDVFNLIDFTLSTQGVIKANKVLVEMQKFIPDCRIEDLPIHYTAVATDFKNKKEVVISEGSLYDAIRASISIPVVFTPVQKEDSLFIDGGILNPVPVNRVHRQYGDVLVAVNVNAITLEMAKMASESESQKSGALHQKLNTIYNSLTRLILPDSKSEAGYFNLIFETTGLILSQVTNLTLQMYPPDTLIEIPRNSYGTFDFYKAGEIIDMGRIHTIEKII